MQGRQLQLLEFESAVSTVDLIDVYEHDYMHEPVYAASTLAAK